MGGDEAEGLFAHLLDGDGVFAEVLFQADEDDGDVGAETARFFYPLFGGRTVSDMAFSVGWWCRRGSTC